MTIGIIKTCLATDCVVLRYLNTMACDKTWTGLDW